MNATQLFINATISMILLIIIVFLLYNSPKILKYIYLKIVNMYKILYISFNILRLLYNIDNVKFIQKFRIISFLINAYLKNVLYNIDFIYFNIREYKRSKVCVNNSSEILFAILFGYIHEHNSKLNVDILTKFFNENFVYNYFKYSVELVENRLSSDISTNILTDLELAYMCKYYSRKKKLFQKHYSSILTDNYIGSFKSFFKYAYFSFKYEHKIRVILVENTMKKFKL